MPTFDLTEYDLYLALTPADHIVMLLRPNAR